MIHVYDFTDAEVLSAWTPAWGRLLAMVQGDWNSNSSAKLWLQIRMRGQDAEQTPITRAGIDLASPSDSIYSPAFTYLKTNSIDDRASNFFSCDALEDCHYDFRWVQNGELTNGNETLQGIVKTFAEIPLYLR